MSGKCKHKYGRTESCLVEHFGNECHCFDGIPLKCIFCGKEECQHDYVVGDIHYFTSNNDSRLMYKELGSGFFVEYKCRKCGEVKK
jgi:hypothetical protein